jgi:predicted DNA binding protein
MSSEQIAEIKRVNEKRERELESRIYEFNLKRDEIYAKAKAEARKEDEQERKEFKEKIQRVKKQEVALFKKQHGKQITDLQLKVARLEGENRTPLHQ